jgi:hypothetical protein
MKMLASILILSALLSFTSKKQQPIAPKAGRDTVRDLSKQPKHKVVTGRSARMRLQQKQIAYHKKQIKKVDEAQKQLEKDTAKHP